MIKIILISPVVYGKLPFFRMWHDFLTDKLHVDFKISCYVTPSLGVVPGCPCMFSQNPRHPGFTTFMTF